MPRTVFPNNIIIYYVTVLEELKEVEAELDEEKLSSLVAQDEVSSTQQLNNSSNWEVSLWPVQGVVCLRMMSAALNTPTDQLIHSLSARMKALPLVTPKLPAVLDNITECQLLASNHFWDQLSRSPILTSARCWLTFSSLYEKNHSKQEEVDKFYLEDHQRVEYVSMLQLKLSVYNKNSKKIHS